MLFSPLFLLIFLYSLLNFCYSIPCMKDHIQQFIADVRSWGQGWWIFLEKRFVSIGTKFEARKDTIVDILLARRGSYQWPFLHLSLVVLLIAGFAAAPIVASSYPGSSQALNEYTPPSAVIAPLDLSEGIQTQRSEKPRDQVISYMVQSGDTISKIGEKFGISVDTIKWANDLKKDSLTIGQTIKIPPISGIVHSVREGESIYSIAKKYKAEAQNIVNFPFNDFADPETFALSVGQTLYVPDGIMPEAPAPVVSRQFIASTGTGTGKLLWPAGGMITQYPSWYHNAIDIANNEAPGIAAAASGVVVLVEYLRWGYGYHVIIDHGDGLSTLYGHMQAIYVKPGDRVARGQIIGKMGSTGRSTGTHLHFEARVNGVTSNPLGYFK